MTRVKAGQECVVVTYTPTRPGDRLVVMDSGQILLDRHDQHLVTAIGRANRVAVTIHLDRPVVGHLVETTELDELFIFVEQKKPAYVMTAVDRATRYIVGVAVVWERTIEPWRAKARPIRWKATNAGLRHYLARLGRASRCFSRSIEALRSAVCLFAYAWSARQLYKREHLRYPAHIRDFTPA